MDVLILQKVLLLLFMQIHKSLAKAWNFVKSPGTWMEKVLEKVKKSPGKS